MPTEVVNSGICWHALRPTTVLPQFQVKPDLCGGGLADLCASLPSAAPGRPFSLINWSQDASASWAPIQVPACLLRQSPVWD